MGKTLTVSWRIKFRAFFITFGSWSDSWSISLPPLVDGFSKVLIDDRGVFLRVEVS